jgi:methylmalonyl-CoA mutase N-terminal domain/subunit
VNKFTEKDEKPIELLQIDATAERRQVEKLREVKARRSANEVEKALANLKRAAEGTANTMPFILDAVRVYATVGEIAAALGEVFGSYTETSVL